MTMTISINQIGFGLLMLSAAQSQATLVVEWQTWRATFQAGEPELA